MYIADNIIRNKLKNVYFIWGRGKTTVANKLRDKCGCCVFSTDEARDRETHFLQEVTPMIIADLIEASAQYETVICEGDIDYTAIVPTAENFVYLNNCGTKFDWFDRPDHENIFDVTGKRTDLTDDEKAAVIQNAYDAVSGNEGVVPDWVLENGVKVISWDDDVTADETVAETAKYFGLK